MIFSTLLLLFPVSLAVDVWTPFLNEEGLEYDASEFEGLELSRWDSQKGGNGGGAWADDCEGKGRGIARIQMQCGKFVGSFRLQCKNNQWLHKRGLGRGNGAGKVETVSGKGITKVVIKAGSYVDRITLWRGKSKVKTCGRSNGGHRYVAKAPAGMQLCALRGRAGWWMDKIGAGWCKKPTKPRPNITYKLNKRGKNWTQAKDDCARQGGRLATINGKAENNKVLKVIGRHHAWIGANDISGEGKWRSIDGTPLKYTQWQPGEPNNSRNEDCAEMYGSHGGNWNDLPCGHGRYYVCEFGFKKNKKVGQKHFRFFRMSKNWVQARAYCKSKGGDLAKIANAKENAQVDSIIERNHAYISINDRASEGKFKNADGTPAKYTNWYPGEPNNVGRGGEDCVEIYGEHAGRWNDLKCSTGRYFVCQFVKARKVPARPKTPGCYVFTPTGCPKQKFDAHKWTRDSWGEANRNSGASKSRCLSRRKKEYDAWCGAKNTVMHFNAMANPRTNGCYVLTPSGCPKQKFNARVWTRDSWGEMHRNARYNRNACLGTRKKDYDAWCGAKDTKMFWNRTPYPKKPSKAGCYIFTPTGCPKQKFNAKVYTRDVWGEANRNSGASRNRCLVTRTKEYNNWCGSKDAQMHFVAMKNPTKSGCYVLTPTGCPKQKFNARVWTRDVWGEANRGAIFSRNACLSTRKKDYDAWCGSKDTKMVWNKTPFPARPKKPGCYVFTPAGCPKQKWAALRWTRDTWGEANRNSGASRSRCTATRKREYDAWCGSKHTYMHFNPMPKPKASGCYVLTPTGCPKQKFNARVWTRDTWGEMHRNARYNKAACLSTRTKDFNAWCGAKDTKMVWNRTPFPKKPTAPGCYIFTPTGCPKQSFNAKVYVRDAWGIANRNAGASRARCLVTRRNEFNGWCGSKDAQMHFVRMPNPSKPGCYVLTPTGCPKQKFNARTWTRDTWGEAQRNAKYNRGACTSTRKREFDVWCGAKDTRMHWNRSPFPARPKTPGCYVFSPSGCPKQRWNSSGKFVRDTWGEVNRNAGASRSRCLTTRKGEYDAWCGSRDTYMHFNPMPNPTKSGCWVLTPTGCPKQKNFNARKWTKDTWGEAHRGAIFNQSACLSTRKREYDAWCGAKDTKMFWNRTPFPKRPRTPGCYVFTPSGCPKQKWNSAGKFVRDSWGEANRNAGASRSRCLATRKNEYNGWCGSRDTYMHFNPLPKPNKPGCWALTPTGCPKQKNFNARTWYKDIWGETHRNARYNRNACLKTRTNDYNGWCGAKDTQMFFVPTPMPARPKKPGCYVFTPTGCPKQRNWNASKFVRDTWGIAHRNAGASRSRCLTTRKNEYNGWCGAGDTQMHYVPFGPPKKPGCHVLTPSGCPKQKNFNARVWTHDTWGEANRHAKFNRGACLTTRKKEFDAWCGAKDTRMHWNKSPFPARPKSAGCYVYSPSGCPKQKWNSAGKFVRDTWGEVNRNSGASKSRCLTTRKNEYNAWCGSKDTYMHWVKMPVPRTAGCYVLTPTGCPKQKYNARVWTRDTWGEMHRNARYNRAACLTTRTKDFNGWCGAKDTKMFWKASPMPARPKTAGCYVFTPTGCPKQAWNTSGKFVRDTWGERHRNAYKNRNACLATRKKEYNAWCGSGDTQMIWNRPPAPKKCCAWFYQHCWYNTRGNDRHGWKFRACKGSAWIDGSNGRGKNDHLSSVKVDSGCKLTLYEHSNYRGRAITLTGNTKCLVHKHMTPFKTWNDQVSSWKLPPKAFTIEPMTEAELDEMYDQFAQEQEETEVGDENSSIVYGAFGLFGIGIVGIGVYFFRNRQQDYEPILSP